ncbi:uncharacterized protein ATC70_011867 [Mucor velutinosus]|uniref:Ras-GEF domain-containing protein n=1 Tax=Mucor velutinosus TaxID=708070 RepID=A0AAN7DB36_9FUNG|nr:hypothetical protein ATC70_011867 [Mucor velutinosus]
MRLPLIPLSPYIQILREYAQILAQTTKSLSEQQDNANIKSSLEKRLNKEREKLDRLTKSMQTIQSSCLLDFNIYDIAKEIAYINCSLFRMVTLDPTWLCNFDKQSNMVPLLDFHRYLSHSFAHQVIYGDPKKKSVIQLIHLSYILLHVYRDFSGCTAILTTLHMPEVRRLESMWAPCPVKLLQVYQELVAMLSPDNNYEVYRHQLWLNTQRFLDLTPSKSQIIAVPFMHAHLDIIQNLVQTHASVQAAPDVVLSSAGQPLLASTVQLLEFCQQFNKMDPIDHCSLKSKRASTTSNNKAIKLSTSPCLDLDILQSDANVYHWIVSRAYLTRSQLHAESLHVEPLAVGEIELEAEEEHDLYWDFFDQQEPVAVIKEPSLKQVDVKDPVQATVDALDVVDSVGESSLVVVHTEQASIVVELDAVDNVKAASIHNGTLSEDHIALEDPEEQPFADMEEVESVLPEPMEYDDDDGDDDIIVLTEEDDEEWTGYPLDSTMPSQTVQDTEEEEEEDEEWTGYPITSQDEQDTAEEEKEEDEEEEVWKGYPIPSSETSPVNLSSSSASPSEQGTHRHEEWKGYQKTTEQQQQQQQQQQQLPQQHDHYPLHAIGKAAARRMQHSLSNTDTHRKRLPSPFAPSSCST